MAAKKDTPLKNVKRHPVHLAEIAFRELSLPGSLHTRADEERLGRIWRGTEFLDQLLSSWKVTVDDLLEQYEVTKNAAKLVAGLKALNTPIKLKEAEEYEKELVKVNWGDALTMVSDHMEDAEDFDEVKLTRILEVLLDKPVRLTSDNPRLRSELREKEDGFLEEHRVAINPKRSKA